MGEQWIAVVAAGIATGGALLGVVVGAVLGPWLGERHRRIEAVEARYADALAKVRITQTLRTFPTTVPADYLDLIGDSSAKVEVFNFEKRAEAVAAFYSAMTDARASLAVIQDDQPAIRKALQNWELLEQDTDSIEQAISDGRRKALKVAGRSRLLTRSVRSSS